MGIIVSARKLTAYRGTLSKALLRTTPFAVAVDIVVVVVVVARNRRNVRHATLERACGGMHCLHERNKVLFAQLSPESVN